MLCESCKDQKREDTQGQCKSCTCTTTSGSYNLCLGCSKMRGQCRCCRQKVKLESVAFKVRAHAFLL